jgi:hypothetical protein
VPGRLSCWKTFALLSEPDQLITMPVAAAFPWLEMIVRAPCARRIPLPANTTTSIWPDQPRRTLTIQARLFGHTFTLHYDLNPATQTESLRCQFGEMCDQKKVRNTCDGMCTGKKRPLLTANKQG